MPERASIAARMEAGFMAVVMVLAAIGLTLLPLTSAAYVRTLVSAVGAEELTGMGVEETFGAAETVRRFVLNRSAPPLPERLGGQKAFDRAASSHLVDVRNVLVPARTVTAAAFVVALAWAVARRRRLTLLAGTLVTAAWALLVMVAAALLVGLSNFDSFFTWFHSLFFAAGTWTFPPDALLIRVFPLAFWTSAAATWAGLVLMSSGLLTIFARHLRIRARTLGV